MSLVSRLRNFVGMKSVVPGGSIPATWPTNWFQLGYSPTYSTSSSVVEACVSAYAQTIAQCPGYHYKVDEYGTRTILWDSPVTKLLEKPNEFQTRSDFLLNLIYQLLYTGNAYFVGNGETGRTHDRLYLLESNQTMPRRVPQTGDIFYETGGEFFDMMDGERDSTLIPSRYIGHVRLYTPRDPLIGVTPITAAAGSVAVNQAITNHQASFFTNMSRPSGVLSTDIDLSREQMTQLRTAWEERSKGLNAGAVPILANGLKWQALSMSNQDAELVDAWKMSIEDISRVFRVPLMLINRMEEMTFNNAEAMMQFWLASGLGFMVDHIELTFKMFFNLPMNHGINFDTEALLRTDMQARFTALGEGVTKGILSPNEARNREGLPPVEGGDQPRVQQQMVPLNWSPDQGDPNTTPPADDTPPPEDEQTMALAPFLVKSAMREGYRDAA